MAKYRLLAVHAHPDDEASKGAATLARYADEGHTVMVATLTGCLLYTSPSPRDLSTSRMPSSA